MTSPDTALHQHLNLAWHRNDRIVITADSCVLRVVVLRSNVYESLPLCPGISPLDN